MAFGNLRLDAGDLIVVSGKTYRIDHLSNGEITFASEAGGELNRKMTQEAFLAGCASGDIRHFRRPSSRSGQMSQFADETLSSRPPDLASETLWRLAYVEEFFTFEAKGDAKRSIDSVNEVLDELQRRVDHITIVAQTSGGRSRSRQPVVTHRPPAARTLLDWVLRYERGGRSPFALAPKRSKRGRKGSRLGYSSEMLLTQCVAAFGDRNRPTRLQIVELVERRFNEENQRRVAAGQAQLKVPSGRTVYRRISELDAFQVCAAREGIEAATRKFALSERGVEATYPMERIEIDECKIDLITLFAEAGALQGLSRRQLKEVKRGRRWICVAIDCATRCIVGIRLIERPNAEDAILTIKDAVSDKSDIARLVGCERPWAEHGGLGVVAADQGAAFMDDRFRAAVTDIGGSILYPPGGTPHLRGIIERLFRTFGTMLLPLLSGRTFSNVLEKGDDDPSERAVLTDDELFRVLIRFIVDVYHQSPHASLAGETPAAAWRRLSTKYGVVPPPDAASRRMVFGERFRRRVDGRGVRLFGLHYANAGLRELYLSRENAMIDIRVDIDDLGWILVRRGNAWEPARCVQDGLDGVSFADWHAASSAIFARHGADAILSAPSVKRALGDIRHLNLAAMDRMSLEHRVLTKARLNNEKSGMFQGMRFEEPLADMFSDTAPSGEDGEADRFRFSLPASGSDDGGADPFDIDSGGDRESDEATDAPGDSTQGNGWRIED